MAELDAILSEAISLGASDVHLKPGRPPTLRVSTRLAVLDETPPLTDQDMEAILGRILDDTHRKQFEDRHQVDLAYGSNDLGRFRVNVFRQQGEPAIAMRVISSNILRVEQLNLPPVINKIAMMPRGLVLVTGTTGSGKSTTLAAMIRHINEQGARHIITVEDPLEYVHTEINSIIDQREIGFDCMSFSEGLRGALRQDPDVILVGEMRDLETIETAMLAAETGHLVLSTLHTLDATETLTRIISVFPEHQRDQIRLILSGVLQGVVSQRLIRRADGAGMVPAVEVMVSTARIRECISLKEKTHEIRDAIAVGYQTYGMQTFDQSLLNLFRSNLITYDDAITQASNPADFALKLRGIASTSDRSWEDFEGSPAGEGEEEEGAGDDLKIDRF